MAGTQLFPIIYDYISDRSRNRTVAFGWEYMSVFFRVIGIVVGGLGLLVPVREGSAEKLPPFKILANGTRYELALGPEQRKLQEVSVYFESAGNVSSAVVFEIEGPPELRGTVSSVLVPKGGGDESVLLESAGATEPLQILGPKGKGYDAVVIDGTNGGGGIRAVYHLHKDACLPRASTRYLSRLTLDLSKIDRALYDPGFVVRLAMQEVPFSGSQIASIKPSSDGKYRGEPILLMGTISYGGEYATITKRKGGKVRSRSRIPVVKYVSYKGRSLSLARLRGKLRGGKATVELSNGGFIYGVCFKLERRRQVRNGYPL